MDDKSRSVRLAGQTALLEVIWMLMRFLRQQAIGKRAMRFKRPLKIDEWPMRQERAI
jgi:hypothetical protein